MRSHMNKKGEGEKANQTVTKLPVRIKYWIYILYSLTYVTIKHYFNKK